MLCIAAPRLFFLGPACSSRSEPPRNNRQPLYRLFPISSLSSLLLSLPGDVVDFLALSDERADLWGRRLVAEERGCASCLLVTVNLTIRWTVVVSTSGSELYLAGKSCRFCSQETTSRDLSRLHLGDVISVLYDVIFEGGSTVFMLDRSGPFFFISGNQASCTADQKLIIVVLAADHTPSGPSPTPPPPMPSLMSPPSMALPTGAPMAPPSGAPMPTPKSAPSPTGSAPGLCSRCNSRMSTGYPENSRLAAIILTRYRITKASSSRKRGSFRKSSKFSFIAKKTYPQEQ